MNWYLKVLKQYADFKGRARRKEYWMFFLFNIIISYALLFLGILLESGLLSTLSTIYSLAVFLPGLAVGVRRVHDVGKSGWYLLIPFYNIYLVCSDSEPGTNNWGDNPKGIGNDSVIDAIGTE
ncbi:DUF805 domain-containing protein [Formosa algae]|uniref:Uncharacterized membrane protein YhaH (DUF805 family) n=1 Tax=Formosa algae TaxID=225843 RepID=A0A9X0YN88_9FLAO|nr:DUF805 domain-containing protein [Formosa algae]MBP1841676.1 uncharacterized membrane protein YhaH (DUF805 family) [Formosa algae]MDQ0337123.1 uncharacterized membrane protein YhaH (DUF805 family) [Formosa algae]OEI80542.1 hypothetical protein AST99_08740 [Formosa algae]